jgi:hypothetical protein
VALLGDGDEADDLVILARHEHCAVLIGGAIERLADPAGDDVADLDWISPGRNAFGQAMAERLHCLAVGRLVGTKLHSGPPAMTLGTGPYGPNCR